MADIISQSQNSLVLLGIETGGITCGVGVWRDEEVIGEALLRIPHIHSRALGELISGVLTSAELTPGELSAVVLSAGPGSFTGLRIGYSVAKGLAHALSIPIVEVPTLDVLAYQAGRQEMPIFPLIDARRGEIFGALYEWQAHAPVRIGEYRLLKPEQLPRMLPGPVYLVGRDALRLRPLLEPHLPPNSRFPEGAPGDPQLWALLHLGRDRYLNREFSDPASCEPMYMRRFKGVS